jgi:hypothetical protein
MDFFRHPDGIAIAQCCTRTSFHTEVVMRSRLLVLSIAVLLWSVPQSATADVIVVPFPAPIGDVLLDATIGGSLIVEAGGVPVVATYLGSGALNDSELFLDSPPNALGIIFDTATSTPGDTEILGVFPAGSELIFGIEVLDVLTDDTFNFFTGPASRNFDNRPHAAVADADTLPPAVLALLPFLVGTTLVGFEDVPFGHPFYDADYNDVVFAFTNVRIAAPAAVPEPTALLLLGTGAAGLLVRARRRTK